MPPVLGYFTLRYLCEGMSWTTPAMAIALIALVLKVPLNLLFIYGAFGFEGLGGAGCGWSSALVMWFELAAMLVVVLATRMRRIGLFSRYLAAAIRARFCGSSGSACRSARRCSSKWRSSR